MLLPSRHPWHQVAAAQLPGCIILQSEDETGVNENERESWTIMFHRMRSGAVRVMLEEPVFGFFDQFKYGLGQNHGLLLCRDYSIKITLSNISTFPLGILLVLDKLNSRIIIHWPQMNLLFYVMPSCPNFHFGDCCLSFLPTIILYEPQPEIWGWAL